ncbi:MAG: hypothetical protein ACRDTG_28930 [Pseudonocardiaceae bacterium]
MTTADKELAKIRRDQPRDADLPERAMITLGEDTYPASRVQE